MRQFAGCCRFVWNRALALEKETFASEGKRLGYNQLAKLLVAWKHEEETSFLRQAHSQVLQQSLKNLDQAYKNFFAKRAEFPRFKRRGVHDAFRYPQGFKVDEGNRRVYLPKIGWVHYRKSRSMEGTPKNVTVSLHAGKWNISIQTERMVEQPKHLSVKSVGIDMGITSFATLSDGTATAPKNAFRAYAKKLAHLQRKLAKRVKFSANWQKLKVRIARLHQTIANVRKDFLHKLSTTICKNHALVVVEALQVKNMSRSAKGTSEQHGRNVWAKSGLNKSILDQGWGEFRRQLSYKLSWLGGRLVEVPPQYTSQTCSKCGHTSKDNRTSQAHFQCTTCGFSTNADYNAALNILAAGLAVSASGVERAQASTMKQEPSSLAPNPCG